MVYNLILSNCPDAALPILHNWLDCLDAAVGYGAASTIMMPSGLPAFEQARGSYSGALLSRLLSQKSQIASSEGSGLNAAFEGHVIEGFLEAAFHEMGARRFPYVCRNADPGAAKPGDYLTERSKAFPGTLFPASFRSVPGYITRPDIRVALGGGLEALFDLCSEGQRFHVLYKGGGSSTWGGYVAYGPGSWLKVPQVVYIAEVIYPDLNRKNPEMARLLHQHYRQWNPDPPQIPK